MEASKSIGIADLLAQVRTEIDLAQDNLIRSGKEGAIEWESAEVEISFGVTKSADANGKVNFHIFAIEAGGEYKSEEVHRLTLRLKPHQEHMSGSEDWAARLRKGHVVALVTDPQKFGISTEG